MTTNKQQSRNLLTNTSKRTYALAILMATVLVGCSEPKELEPKELTGQEILDYIDYSGEVTELYLETYLEYVFKVCTVARVEWSP